MSTVSQSEQAAATTSYLAAQHALTTSLARDIVTLIRRLFDVADPGRSWPGVRTAVAGLIEAGRRDATGLAVDFYRHSRAAAVPHPQIPDRDLDLPEPAPVTAARMDATVDATGIGSYRRAVRAGQLRELAADTMAVTLTGSAQYLAQEAARETIRDAVAADADAIGWMRVTDADPCSWCAMLASRGPVYRSAQTAGRGQDTRFDGDGQFKWHNHCGCTAVPVFDPDDPRLQAADDLYEQWLRETAGHSGNAAVNAWRRYWDSRDRPGDPAQPLI